MPAIDWNPQLEQSVVTAIANGMTLRQTGEAAGMSAAAIIWHVRENAEFAKQYAHAMETRCDIEFEALQEELSVEPERTNYGTIDPAWVNLKRLQVDTRKWALSKRQPKKYGDKLDLAHTGADGGPIQAAITVEFVKTKNINAHSKD